MLSPWRINIIYEYFSGKNAQERQATVVQQFKEEQKMEEGQQIE